MNVTCHAERIAYVPPGFDVGDAHSGIVAAGYRIIESPDLPTAQLVDKGCGRTFTIDDDTSGWDVTTDESGNVVERHRAVTCPHCGTTADHLSIVEPA